jgi:hypothetical protein
MDDDLTTPSFGDRLGELIKEFGPKMTISALIKNLQMAETDLHMLFVQTAIHQAFEGLSASLAGAVEHPRTETAVLLD